MDPNMRAAMAQAKAEAAENARIIRLMEEDVARSAALCAQAAYEDAMRSPIPPPPETRRALAAACDAADAALARLTERPENDAANQEPPRQRHSLWASRVDEPPAETPPDAPAAPGAAAGSPYERTGGWTFDDDPHGALPQVPAHADHGLPCCPRRPDGSLDSYYLLSFDEIAEHDFRAPPVLVARGQWSVDRQEHFIRALAASASVSDACAAVGCTRNAAYRLRWHPQAAAFRRAWDAALSRALRVVADTAFDRAVNGVEEPVWHGGRLVGTRRVYNDALLMFLLRGRENSNMEARAKRSPDTPPDA